MGTSVGRVPFGLLRIQKKCFHSGGLTAFLVETVDCPLLYLRLNFGPLHGAPMQHQAVPAQDLEHGRGRLLEGASNSSRGICCRTFRGGRRALFVHEIKPRPAEHPFRTCFGKYAPAHDSAHGRGRAFEYRESTPDACLVRSHEP